MDNSFFDDDFYDNKKILILAPHPDDEINIAYFGNFYYTKRHFEAIFFAFDYKYNIIEH